MIHPTEQIEAAVTGGLTESEQTAFEEHVAGCLACAGLLAEARVADAAMNKLFAGHQPDDDFEERMILNIRRRQVRITHPLVRRIAVGVAASIVLGGIGYVGSAGISNGRLPGYTFVTPQKVGVGNSALSESRGRRTVRSAGTNDNNATADDWVRQGNLPATQPSAGGATDVSAYSNLGSWREFDRNGFAPATQAPASSRDDSLRYRLRGATSFNLFDAGQGGAEELSKRGMEPNRSYFKTLNPEPSRYVTDSKSLLNGLLGGLAITPPTPRVSLNTADITGFDRVQEAEARFDPHAFTDAKYTHKDQPFAGQNIQRPQGGGIGAGGGGARVDELSRTAGDTWGTPVNGAVKNPTFAYTSAKRQPPALQSGPISGKPADGLGLQNGDEGKKAESKDSKTIEENIKLVESEKDKKPALVLASDAKPDAQGPQSQAAPPTAPAVEPAHGDILAKPKIIRTGEMEFEVDSFDSTVGIIYKVIAEEQGYISTTNSDKLANGKVKGSVVLRVPAEHLDTLVLKLRGIGDLRSQHINAQDITKQFTDTESALRAAKAMQERLLDIIKNGKGAVKDLLEAEKQLGTWREKVEQLEGEIRYYSNQVSMSTLTLTLFERDIRQPALASETETVTMALETDKVEDAYAKAKDAIVQAKGRIVNSELKQFDAGQFGGTITAQVPPDAADATIGRIKQLDGRIARFERQRNQTTSNGNAPADGRLAADPVKVKREDVTINLTLYNLANVAPRRTTTLTVVAGDVEKSYHTLIDQVRSAGGRVITSQINRGKEDQVAGAVNFNVPMEKADSVLAALHGFGEVLKTETAESPDTQNVTETKRGFIVTIGSLSAFPARETQQIQLAAVVVPDAFNDLLNTLRTGAGRIITSRLNDDRGNANATLEFEIGRDTVGAVEKAIAKDGQVITRVVNRSTDTDNTVDSKLRIALVIGSSEQLPPRQITEMSVEVTDVQKAMDDLQAAALSAGGRQVDNPAINQGDGGQTIATLTLDVPLDKVGNLVDSADAKGIRKSRRTAIDAHAPEGRLARARLQVTFSTPATLTGNDGGALAGIRSGLGTSIRGLSYSLMMIVIGVCLVAPWALLIGIIWRAVKWARKSRVMAPPVAG